MIIVSFFTSNSVPATGLTPTINIWSLTGTAASLVITGGTLTEVGDGLYQYNFTTYDATLDYAFRVDGGATLDNAERYHAGSIDLGTISSTQITDITDSVWNATASNYVATGSTGLTLNEIKADTTAISNNLYVSANSVLDIVNIIVKYETNRTKIDTAAGTLTVYDDDCTTPLRVFQLLDANGNPSVSQVAERKPISATDGLPYC